MAASSVPDPALGYIEKVPSEVLHGCEISPCVEEMFAEHIRHVCAEHTYSAFVRRLKH